MSTARAVYYLVLIALLMPALPDSRQKTASNAEIVVAQGAAASDKDKSWLCQSGHNVCGATAYLLRKFEAKALYPLQVMSSWSIDADWIEPEHRA